MEPVEKSRLLSLGAQAFLLGFALSFIFATSNTLFLIDQGSERLPQAYIVIGLVISGTSYTLATLQRKRSTGAVATGGPLQQHDALARKTLDQVVGGGHARVAAADDGDVGPLPALERRVDGLAVEPSRLEPEAVHEKFMCGRGTILVI